MCDRHGVVIPGADVHSGDIVAVAMYISKVYDDRGSKQFGIAWALEDVCIARQHGATVAKSEVPVPHKMHYYPFLNDFEYPCSRILWKTPSQEHKSQALSLVRDFLLQSDKRVAHTVLRYTNMLCVSAKRARTTRTDSYAQTLCALRAVCRIE